MISVVKGDIGDKQLSLISEEINIEIKGVKLKTDKENNKKNDYIYIRSQSLFRCLLAKTMIFCS